MKRIGKLLLVVCSVLLLAGCSKKVVTTDSFKNILKQQKMAVYDMTKKMPSDVNIKEATIGQSDDEWKVEYYIFKDDKSAQTVYETNENRLKTAKSLVKTNGTNKDTFKKFEVDTKDHYMVVIRNKNSVLYTIVDKEYKEDLNKIISKMNY